MARKKRKSKSSKLRTDIKAQEVVSPIAQKFALILFGLGPIALMGWFLYSKGFFDPI